jgi:hypothetical protein
MNKAIEGNNEEVIITKLLNTKTSHWDNLPYERNNTFAIHIISKKFGKVNNEKIQPKADIFFVSGDVDLNFLINNEYYLDETHVKKFKLSPIQYSGLSIKLANSNYTITKISPNTFLKIFKSNILGAGASVYSSKDFYKNSEILLGWGVTKSDFDIYFSNKLQLSKIDLLDSEIMTKVKTYSNHEIGKIINENSVISDLIFKGIGNFEEPYTAHWILENNILKKNYFIPFNITTGSGRSKHIFTIVLKPK